MKKKITLKAMLWAITSVLTWWYLPQVVPVFDGAGLIVVSGLAGFIVHALTNVPLDNAFDGQPNRGSH